jgi:hypothetical protein
MCETYATSITLATYVWNRWNILNKPLKHSQHASETLATSQIYFCNIPLERLKHLHLQHALSSQHLLAKVVHTAATTATPLLIGNGGAGRTSTAPHQHIGARGDRAWHIAAERDAQRDRAGVVGKERAQWWRGRDAGWWSRATQKRGVWWERRQQRAQAQ